MAIWTSPNYPDFNPTLSALYPDGTPTDIHPVYPYWNHASIEKSTYSILYTLKTGWNWVSFPMEFHSTNANLATLIPPATYPTIDKITGGLDVSSASTAIDGAWVGSISAVLATSGYFVHNNSETTDVTLEVRGACLYGTGATNVSWGSGNNFISYPLCNDMGLDAAIQYDLPADRINRFLTNGLAAFWIDGSDKFIGSLDTFKQGVGYWVNVDVGLDGAVWEDNTTPRPMTGHPIWILGVPPGPGASNYDNQPFHFHQSINQSYYFLQHGAFDINGIELIPGEDWVSTFRGDICCGSQWYNGIVDTTYSGITDESGTVYSSPGYTTLAANMQGSSLNPWGETSSFAEYQAGENPSFVIYQHSTEKYYTAKFKNTSTGALIDMSSYTIALNQGHVVDGHLHAISEIT